MSLGRIIQFLRSYAQLSALKLNSDVANVVHRPSSPIVMRAEQEQATVNAAIQNIYWANVRNFVNQLDSQQLLGAVENNYKQVNDMFLRGMISEIVETSPSLPTEPFDRVSVHLLANFMKEDEITLDEARERVQKTVAIYNEANELFDWITDMGRHAYQTSASDLLIQCHNAARRNRA